MSSISNESHHPRCSIGTFFPCHMHLKVLGRLQDRPMAPRPKEKVHISLQLHVLLQSLKVQQLCPASKHSTGCAEQHPQLFLHSFIIRRGLSNILSANPKPPRHQQTL
jgi:hypothetical protein